MQASDSQVQQWKPRMHECMRARGFEFVFADKVYSTYWVGCLERIDAIGYQVSIINLATSLFRLQV